ncbi:hypothetical protein A0H81_09468 [Grifola frondosa]|uniref:Uncharacterized protein n=1 Tax=Grifola frondosa TaxID=5627 RepID=A0A1C7M6J9_GRIFR|nr:hypothetical protein A0H81_09468 [Grifola frondosa]
MSLLDEASFGIVLPEPSDVRPLRGQVVRQPLPGTSSYASSATGDRQVRDIMDEKDNGCLITNIHRHTDRRVYMINVQRGDNRKKSDVESFFYTELGISAVPDPIDHISNLFWLDSTLGSAFDQYHLFAITVSKETGLQIKKLLEDELAYREEMLNKGYALRRAFYNPLSPAKDLEFVRKPELQMVALLPHQLLPHGFPLIRRRRGTTDDNPVYDTYTVADDGLLRSTDGEHQVFPSQTQETIREGEEVLNVWFLLINAASKFQHHQRRYGLDHFPEDIKEAINLTINIVELIYRQVGATTDLEQTALVGRRWPGRTLVKRDYREYDKSDGPHDNDAETMPEEHEGSPAGGLGPQYSSTSFIPCYYAYFTSALPRVAAGFRAIKDPAERALYVSKWLFGYDEMDAAHDEMFGRQPTETAYSANPDTMQQWAGNVSI